MTGIFNRFVLMTGGIIILSWLIFIKASSITPMSLDATLNSYETVELTNPLRLEPIPDFYPYESVLKLIISIKIPTFKKAAANEAMKSVFSRVKEEIKAMDAQDDSAHTQRQRLQAPINSVLGRMSDSILGTEGLIRSYINIFEENDIPGFSIATMNTTDFETLMTDALTEIMKDARPAEPEPDQIEENVPALLELEEVDPLSNQTGSVNAMSESANDDNTTTTTHKPPCSVQVEREKMLKFSRILTDHMNAAVASCQERKLPLILVKNILKTKLGEISQGSSSSASSIYDESDFFNNNGRVSLPRGYKLVISPDKFQLYANQSMTDCLFTEKQIYVVVNIPLVSRNSKWQIYQSHHSKFIFEEQICSIGSSNNGLASSKLYGFDKNNDNIVELDSHSGFSRYPSSCEYNRKVQMNSNTYTNISSNQNQLCFIPQTQGEHTVNEKDSNSKTADSFTCAAGILNKVPLKDLKHMCQFNCQAIDTLSHGNVNGNVQYFQQLPNKNQVLLTNVKRLKVACPQYNFEKSFEKIGGLKISMHSCDCVIWADDQLYSFPCEDKVMSSVGVGSHIIGVGSAPVNNANFTDLDDDSAEVGGSESTELSDEHNNYEDESHHDNENDHGDNKKGIDVAYLIPITWTKNTKYNMLVEENISFKIKNHKEIIDSDWHKRSGGGNDHAFGAKYWNFFQGEDYSD